MPKMPSFTFLAKDLFIVPVIEHYWELLINEGQLAQADEVEKAIDEIKEWQYNNQDKLKFPDHKHVPVGELK